jgi:hypothetical protein
MSLCKITSTNTTGLTLHMKTLLTTPIYINIIKRNTGKKVLEVLGKKCIGASCKSTRPHWPRGGVPTSATPLAVKPSEQPSSPVMSVSEQKKDDKYFWL